MLRNVGRLTGEPTVLMLLAWQKAGSAGNGMPQASSGTDGDVCIVGCFDAADVAGKLLARPRTMSFDTPVDVLSSCFAPGDDAAFENSDDSESKLDAATFATLFGFTCLLATSLIWQQASASAQAKIALNKTAPIMYELVLSRSVSSNEFSKF